LPLVLALGGGGGGSPDDLVSMDVEGKSVKAVFSYRNETRPPDELLKMNEWNILKDLLIQFKTITSENHIVPILVFIPTKAHIYAEHTTLASGNNWIKIRDQQIAAKDHVEAAMRVLSREIGIELVSLTPVFEDAARKGKFLYYPFDSHWNSEGRQIAANVLAEVLGAKNKKD
jgi:hypothetical protein